MPGVTVDGGELPQTLTIGEFTLDVEQYTSLGRWDEKRNEFLGVAGTAWLRFDCGGVQVGALDPRVRPGLPRLQHDVEVVSRVTSPQTQVSLVEAQRISPEIQIGQTLSLDVAVRPSELQEIVQLAGGVLEWLETAPRSGQVLVDFAKATVSPDKVATGVGHILRGGAVYPADRVFPTVIEIDVDGFTLAISSLKLTPKGASGAVTVRLPGGIAAVDSCAAAVLDLGVVPLTPTCELYVDAPDKSYGPWLLGDTGLQIEGTGFIVDFSTTASPFGWSAGWRGLVLVGGQATGENLVPDPCNTGYLRGHYGFADAVVAHDGFEGTLSLQDPCTFGALNPRGQVLTVTNGWLQVSRSEIVAGEFSPGEITLPVEAVCAGVAGAPVVVGIVGLSVQPDLDLAGVVDCGGRPMSWGELTHTGAEVIAWTALFTQGYAFLPAGAVPSFCPESAGSFLGPSISSVVDASLTQLETYQAAGVTFAELTKANVLSPDRPGGAANPLVLPFLRGWLRVGSLGVDGELLTHVQLSKQELGEPARPGYVGLVPFDADLFTKDNAENLVAQFVTSAVFDSSFGGRFRIPAPCQIPSLDFEHMQVTSTSHLVGGDVDLPAGGVPLDYWKVALTPTGPPSRAGVVSARTGRVVFLAAGISEARHFARPFCLTWGEMLASGNLGELYLDANNYGQRFDGLTFNPHKFLLSAYVPGPTDPYLAAGGSIVFPFFGQGFANIVDAVDANAASPNFGRRVTVPKTGIAPGCPDTDLALAGVWKDILSNDLGIFDCPEAQVDYNVVSQDGFLGTGTAEMGFLHSPGLMLVVDIHSDATDILLSATDTHDVDLGLYARLGGIGQLSGCARIQGPLLTRMSFYGLLEQSAAGGAILGPKAGYAAELDINVTPSSLDFYASGDMSLSVATVDVEVSASVHLFFDLAMLSAEGQLVGQINCDAAVAGLSGEGQITWHIGPGMHYLQGRMKVAVCSFIGGSLEGGFFVGENVPQQLAWVLQPTNPHFGVSPMVLPPLLTGVFGYGQLSFSVNLFVLGGGVDLYAGMGAFTTGPTGMLPAFTGVAGLPYVIGACGIYLHGEIMGGLVSAAAWGNLTLRGPALVFFEGTVGLRGCAAWVLCASVDLTAGFNSAGFYLH